MRIPNEEFLQKPLHVHSFLTDVALHDVWVFHLRGGVGRTLRDFRQLLSEENMQQINPVVKALFKMRSALGRLFRWDDKPSKTPPASYIHRLTAEDRDTSLTKPGTVSIGPFHRIYEFEMEALDETINATVHAFSLMAMESTSGGYMVYWAIYVKNTSTLTPVYMALINPFRRFIVYPAIINKVQKAWSLSQ